MKQCVVKIAHVVAAGALSCLACTAHIETTNALARNDAAGESPDVTTMIADAGASVAPTGDVGAVVRRVNAARRDQVSLACTVPVANKPQKPAETGAPLWVKSFGATNPTTDVATDAEGNVLVASSGVGLLKLDPGGTPLWSKPFGSLVATDANDDVYVAGTLTGTLTVGTSELHTIGGTDVYLVKLDPSGNVLYGVALGGAEDDDALSLAVDASGSALLSGRGLGTVRLDATAHVVWAKPFYGHVALDSDGNALITGELSGAEDFGGGALHSAGGADVFVVKLSAAGEHVFSHRFGDGGAEQRGQAIAVDGSKNVLIGGVFDGELDFGASALSLPSGTCPAEVWCKTAGFVAKLDANGNALWGVSHGPMRSLSGITVDSHERVVVSGAQPGGVSPFHIPLLFELSSSGAERWQRSEWPETGIGSGHRVVVDPCDNVLWTVSALPSLGGDERPYLAKLSQ